MIVTADTEFMVGGTLRPFDSHEFEGMLLSGQVRTRSQVRHDQNDSMERIYSDELGDPVE